MKMRMLTITINLIEVPGETVDPILVLRDFKGAVEVIADRHPLTPDAMMVEVVRLHRDPAA
jgi:hypothetical protein